MKLFRNSTKQLPYNDDFIKRLPSSTISGGMLMDGNLYLMDYAIKNMPENGVVIEIGCWAGLSSNIFLHLMKKYKRKEVFVACDPWIYEGYKDALGERSDLIDGDSSVKRTDFMNYIKQAYTNSMLLFNKESLPHTFHLSSDDFFKHYETQSNLIDIFGREYQLGGEISFCYIDGDHSYEAVKKDFENTDRFLKINGLILLDDSSDNSGFGSRKIIDDIKKNPSYRIVDKNPNYLIQKIK